ncbi:glycosyltransferase [Bradyrhizobium sp. WSM 1738]|uniref:glycosyltransferase family 2 protein n=1 Tax=Bradyrhizobium hereditatis TaxID=2821405 RepID=UPI001CE38BA9|nr:glycosyltransferase [Bradyrhizobium hereditatis]MCA6119989.1 glycosyltransferase [Bradyrhizobium hereditatis]
MNSTLDVVIPAGGDAGLLQRCLVALLCDSVGVDLCVIVVANGPAQSQNQASAQSLLTAFEDERQKLIIVTNPCPGKAAALNRGDRERRKGAVLYLDADTIILPGTVPAIVASLASEEPLLVAPPMVLVRPEGRLARGFASVWPGLSGMENDVVGAGLYATNAAGRSRWSEFPAIAADDLFVRSRFAKSERKLLTMGGFLFNLPRGSDLLRAKRRWDHGNRTLAQRHYVQPGNLPSRSVWHRLGDVVRHWRESPALACFILLALAAWITRDEKDGAVVWVGPKPQPIAAIAPRRPRVGICIVTHNNDSEIEACLASLKSRWSDLSIRIEDNASLDGTVDIVRGTEHRTNIRTNSINRGFAASVNRLAADFGAEIDHLLLINPDVELAPDAIDQLIAASLASENEAIVGGRMMRVDGSIDPSNCLAEPSLRQSIAFALGLRRWPGCRWIDPDTLGGWHRTGIRAVPVLTGAALLINRVLWDRLGGFDEQYFLYGEDVDLCIRAKRLASTTLFTALAQYVHRGGTSSASDFHRWIAILRGKVSLYRQHLPSLRGRSARWLLLGGVALRSMAETSGLAGTKMWRDLWRQRDLWLCGWPQPDGNQLAREVRKTARKR